MEMSILTDLVSNKKKGWGVGVRMLSRTSRKLTSPKLKDKAKVWEDERKLEQE